METMLMETEQCDAVASAAPPLHLTPIIEESIARFLSSGNDLDQLVTALGSPLNILFPCSLARNLEAFQGVFAEHGVSGRVFFAHKTNQSDSLVRQMAVESCSIDVSSLNELRHALSSGFEGRRIEATGPKNREFLALAIMHDVTVSLDSLWEIQTVIDLHNQLGRTVPVKVLIRLSGFQATHSKFLNKGSRFGVSLSEIGEAFGLIEKAGEALRLSGFAFHLDTVSSLERAVAIENCLEIFEDALSRGFEPSVLCIGGGFKVNYLESEEEWNRYTSALKESVLGTREPMTWQGNSFGMFAEKGKLRGNFNSYTYYDLNTGAKFLHELLMTELPNQGNMTAGSVLRDNMIELWIEPGRSLVDQCGITVGRINSLRKSSRGEHMVLVNMKRQDVTFLDQEIFVDPVIIYRSRQDRELSEPVGVYLAGNLCLESDLVYRHLTYIPGLPSPGDLVVFVNTAGYFMDFSASTSMMEPVARKVVVVPTPDGFKWSLDSEYSVV